MSQPTDADLLLERRIAAMIERLREAEGLLERFTPAGPHALPELDRYVAAVHRRTRRLGRAIRLLIDADLPLEAAIIARALFEDSLRLGELASAGPRRTAYILAWLSQSLSQAERMLREGEKGGDFDAAERERILRTRRDHLGELANEFGVRGRWPQFGDEASMARRQGREGELHSYLMATQLAHGNDAGYFLDLDPVGDTRDPADMDTHSPLAAGVALGLSVVPMLRTHLFVAQILGWPGADAAKELLDRKLP